MSEAATETGVPDVGANNLLDARERARLAARRRRGAVFRWLTLVPVLLAIALITTLFADIAIGSISWQVIEANNSGQDFAWSEGFRPLGSWQRVVGLELVAQGMSEADINAFFGDSETVRKFRARNRVELMWSVNGRPLRWLVTSSRDDGVDDLGLFEGWRQRSELLAGLEADQLLVLNPWFDVAFLGKNASRTPVMSGLMSALLGSLWVIVLVIVISLPIGVGTAIYLEEYAPDNTVTRFLELNLRNLAGVPSIVYGILGLAVFVRLMNLGPVILAAAMTLSLLILPVVVIASREAIRAVPDSLRQASYGLGATRWQTIGRVVLPNAVGGIVTGIILSVARAIGETAPLLLVGAAAFVPRLPESPLSPYTVIPIQIFSWISENDVEFPHVASAGILVLLVVLLVLYSAAFYVRRRFERTW